MDKTISLIKNTIIIFVGRFSTQFISFVLLSIYTYFLTTGEYGTIDLIQTYIFLLVPIISLRIDTVFFRFILEYRNSLNGKTQIITNGLYIISILCIIFSVAYFLIGYFIHIPFYVYVYFNIIAVILSNVFMQIARGVGDNLGYSISCILVAILSVFFTFLFFYCFNLKGETILLSTTLANFACCIYLLFRCKINKSFCVNAIDKDVIKKMLKYSIPMIPDGLSWWIVSASDRIIINYYLGNSFNGIYAVSSKFSNILSSLFTVINMSWQESAALYINDEKRDEFFSNIFNDIMNITISICIALMAGMYIVFEFLIDKNYYEAYKYVSVLLIANIFNALSVLQGGILIAKMDTKAVAKSTLIGAMINIFINVSLVKHYGLFAAVFSTLVSYIVICWIRNLEIKKYVRITMKMKKIIFLMILLIVSNCMYYINSMVVSTFYFIIILIVLFLFNKKYLKNLWTLLQKKREKVC